MKPCKYTKQNKTKIKTNTKQQQNNKTNKQTKQNRKQNKTELETKNSGVFVYLGSNYEPRIHFCLFVCSTFSKIYNLSNQIQKMKTDIT